jgi:hypothetical protein
MRLSICSLIEASLIRFPSSVIGGEWSIKATTEYEVFVPRAITLRVRIEDALRLCFAFPGPDFTFSTELRLTPEPDKLVGYANV